MFEAVDFDRDFSVDQLSPAPQGGRDRAKTAMRERSPSEATLAVLEAGFRTRVMSWQTAHDVGARSGLTLGCLRERTEQCAALTRAGLPYAVDETLFAALVYHYPVLSRELSIAFK
ncbi:hypothetical protein SAMN04515647_2340 [Cohaesibacter sp. ES.047]|uniref:hypothetical protein n=1 Tax=Cohaesibacter sp. ES.047 TaxID=1798205 RepID=UPI000BB9A381|nr:hypothetical protein [Cohaesibacter sp. ES.047]SNY92093.1 hypothetical protein SAMN04515647_2340 [Cohaesibacter sp. ES.047]